MEELLNDYPVVIECSVNWGDMDAFRHVNNTVYFRYFENVRVAYGERIGVTDWLESEGLGPILKWIDCKYIKPVTYPDTLMVGVRTESINCSEMKFEYKIVSRTLGAVAAVGSSIGVFYDYRNLRRADFPKEIISRIEKLEGKPVRKNESADDGA